MEDFMHKRSNPKEKASEIYISFEKIQTIISLLGKTLIEDYDYTKKDSLNMCSILEEEVNNTFMKFKDYDNSVKSDKSML